MDNPIPNLIKTAWQQARGYHPMYVSFLILHTMANLLGLLTPYLYGQLIDTLQVANANMWNQSLKYILFLVGIFFLGWIFNGPARLMERTVAFNMEKNFREYLFKIVTKLPLKWHVDHHSGDTIDKISRAVQGLRQYGGQTFMFLRTITALVGSYVALLIMFPKMSLLVLVVIIGAFLIIYGFDKFLYPRYKEQHKRYNFLAAGIHDYISNIITVITLRLEKNVRKEISYRNERIRKLFYSNIKIEESKWFLFSSGINLMQYAFIGYFIWTQIQQGNYLIAGTVVTIYQYLGKIQYSFFDIGWQYGELINMGVSVNNVDSILESYHDLVKDDKQMAMPKQWQQVQINDLYFAYEDTAHQRHSLDKVSLDFKKGDKIALVGISGSGKSTMMSLLRGLYPPESVKVTIDAKEYSYMKMLAGTTTLIPQDPEIFENTIEYNITAGVNSKKKDVLVAAKLARFNGVIERMPKGLDTNINEKGVNLSGGEKQRLALARGIFASKSSDIILLDESTSSVDVANEMKIYENLMKHYKHKTVIASVHKLNLIPYFEKIYVLESGKVIEQGSFKELIKHNGKFKKMWDQYEKSLK